MPETWETIMQSFKGCKNVFSESILDLFIELVVFHFRNQIMRKKLILFFKRRNHARKQRVSASVIWKVLY